MTDPYVNIPPFCNRPKPCGELWTLTKEGRRATCHLYTHPVGGEVRVSVDGEVLRSEAPDGLALVDLGLEWRAQFEQEGWRI
jgi:hypothetical protein